MCNPEDIKKENSENNMNNESNISESSSSTDENLSEKNDSNLEKENKPTAIQAVFEWVQSAFVAVILVVLMLTFVFRLVDVSGDSMYSTLHSKDKVIITNFMYTPKYKDIVVISHAEHYNDAIIKRIIATEGQTVSIDSESGNVMVDGIVIDEPYIYNRTEATGDVEFPITVTEGHVFVMGDNRENSLDSRFTNIGLIDVDNIIGKAQFILYPFDRFTYLY